MITPQYGGFDLKMSGEPTFPISKPLQQQAIKEFMQHPIVQAAVERGYWDAGKLADTLAEIHDYDADKFKAEPSGTGNEAPIQPEEYLELANRENEGFMQGAVIKSTPYAPREHTEVHLAFMSSDQFKQNFDDNIMANIVSHIQGEEQAQISRGELEKPSISGNQPLQRGSVAGGVMGSTAQRAMPGRMVGASPISGRAPGQ
jgi:hypothetical protein